MHDKNKTDPIGRLDVRNAPVFTLEQIRYLEHICFNRLTALGLTIELSVKNMFEAARMMMPFEPSISEKIRGSGDRLFTINEDIRNDFIRLQAFFADSKVKQSYYKQPFVCRDCNKDPCTCLEESP